MYALFLNYCNLLNFQILYDMKELYENFLHENFAKDQELLAREDNGEVLLLLLVLLTKIILLSCKAKL